MLKQWPSPHPAQSLLADPQVRCDLAKWHAFQHMRCLFDQPLVSLRCRAELCIDEAFLQPDVVFLIRDAYNPFDLVELIKEIGQSVFRDAP